MTVNDQLKLFGYIAVQKGFLTHEQFDLILSKNKIEDPSQLGELLIKSKIIDVIQFNAINSMIQKKFNEINQKAQSQLNITVDSTDEELITPMHLSEDKKSLKNFLIKNNLSPRTDLPQSLGVEKNLTESSRYILGPEIAHGGMGAIISTLDLDTKRSLITKKPLKGASKETLLRFIEEAQITAQLEHPNIVPVYDIGVDKSGNVYYTMKHVKGKNLKNLIDQYYLQNIDETEKRNNLNQLVTILVTACNAVAFAHSKKIIHRDLKPENIMIGEYGEVILIDFGLAKILDNHENETIDSKQKITCSVNLNTIQTHEGYILGSPKYMAPEQARGEVNEQDERTDIYALGAILFACVSNTDPIPGKSVTEVLGNVVSCIRHPLPAEVAPELSAIIDKAMAIDKNDRYQTVKEFSDDLHLYLKGYTISAKKDRLSEILVKLIRRNIPVSITVLIAFILLCSFGTVALIRVLQEKEIAVANLNKFKDAQKTADLQKAAITKLQNDKKKEWKTFYNESFTDFKYTLMPRNQNYLDNKEDYGFGNWVVSKGYVSKINFDFEKDAELLLQKVWQEKKSMHLYTPDSAYLYLNKDVFDNLRMDTTIQFIKGETPEISLFICGSREKQELDGYTIAIGPFIKFQKQGQNIYTQKLMQPLQANRKYNIRFERVANFFQVYIDDMSQPVFQWKDSDPLYGKEHSICGFYVWKGEIKIDQFELSKQALAKQNTPEDFVEKLRKKGLKKLAVEEYKEIIDASDDYSKNLDLFFEMGITYKNAKMYSEAIQVFETIIQKKDAEKNRISFSKSNVGELIDKSICFLFLMELEMSFDELDVALIKWPERLKSRYEEVENNCKGHQSIEIIFNDLLININKKGVDKKDPIKRYNLINLFIKLLDEKSPLIAPHSLGGYKNLLSDIYQIYATPLDAPIADEFFSEEIKTNENSAELFRLRGRIRGFFFEDSLKRQEGEKDLLRAVEIEPLSQDGYLFLAEYYYNHLNYDSVINICKKGLIVLPNNCPLLICLARNGYLPANELDNFDRTVVELKKTKATQAEINYLKSCSYLKHHQNESIETLLAESEKFKLSNLDYYALKGNIYMSKRKYREAISFYLKMPKETVLTHQYLAKAYFKNGEYEKAEKSLINLSKIWLLNKEQKELMQKIKEKLNKR